MELNRPWIVSRRRILFAISIDMLLNIYFYSVGYLDKFSTYPNLIVTFSLGIFWVVSSYIIGRYMVCRNINSLEITKAFIKAMIIFISCNFIFLFINFSSQIIIFLIKNEYGLIQFQRNQTLLFLRVTFIISIISWTVQYVLSIITNKIYNNKKYWLFYGTEKGYRSLKKEVKINQKKFNLKLLGINYNYNQLNTNEVVGVVIENNEDNNLDQIYFFKSKGIPVINTLKWCELMLHRIPPILIDNKYQIIEKFNFSDDTYKMRIKRLGDLFVSLLLIFLTLPISLLISIFIYFEDKGPILYSQIRTGYKGERIRIYKFRSMIKNAEKKGPQWAKNEDKRITKVGKIIRATRIDELPQLLSVLDGTMSLIGPRPERPVFEEKFLEEIPFYKYRTIVKPGISGWAQVNYPYGASLEDSINKLSYDIYYINHISFLLDLLILIKTIKTVFNAKGLVSLK